jgi:hypothetical protein
MRTTARSGRHICNATRPHILFTLSTSLTTSANRRRTPAPLGGGRAQTAGAAGGTTPAEVIPTPTSAAISRSSAGAPAGFLSIAWIPERDLQVAEWSRIGQRLGMMGRCNQWWIGDWIRYGNARYGEKYSRAATLTGYDVQTLTNMVYVATRFDDITRRRDGLSWSHHEAVAALQPAMQERWLTMAAGLKWSVNDLRVELRSQRKVDRQSNAEATGDADVEGEERSADHNQAQADAHVSCPHCGQPLPRSLFTT